MDESEEIYALTLENDGDLTHRERAEITHYGKTASENSSHDTLLFHADVTTTTLSTSWEHCSALI
jgi:hypothetical protein